MAVPAMCALFVTWLLASAARLSNAKNFCAHLTGSGHISDSTLGVSIISKQQAASAASWLQQVQQQSRQQDMQIPPCICNLHACSEPATSSSCQMRHVMELDPLQTGVLLLEVSSLQQELHSMQALAKQQQQSSSNASTRQAVNPGFTVLATPQAAMASNAASANSFTVRLAASCTAMHHSSTVGRVNLTAADASQEQHTSRRVEHSHTLASQQYVWEEFDAIWSETVQVTLLQRQSAASSILQDCPAGAAAASVWHVPQNPANNQSDDCHNQEGNSLHPAARQQQQKQQKTDWLARHSMNADADETDLSLSTGDETTDSSAAGSSRTLVMLDLLLPDIHSHWSQGSAVPSSNCSEPLAGSELEQADNLSSVGSLDHVNSLAGPANTGATAWLWLGRLLLAGTVVGVQLAWHHHTNK